MTVLARGHTLTVTERLPQLTDILPSAGGPVPQTLSPEAFTQKFKPLLKLKPQCRYFVRFQERTELVAPRKAVDGVFYMMRR